MDMPAGEARARIDRAKASVGQAREELIALWNGRAWISLGHASWDALCEAEFWGIRVALPVSERREVVSSMRAEGMSTRAIGSALGVGKSTVDRDLSTVPSGTVGTSAIAEHAADIVPQHEPGTRSHDALRRLVVVAADLADLLDCSGEQQAAPPRGA